MVDNINSLRRQINNQSFTSTQSALSRKPNQDTAHTQSYQLNERNQLQSKLKHLDVVTNRLANPMAKQKKFERQLTKVSQRMSEYASSNDAKNENIRRKRGREKISSHNSLEEDASLQSSSLN